VRCLDTPLKYCLTESASPLADDNATRRLGAPRTQICIVEEPRTEHSGKLLH
jgi:hypothetical protein